MMFTVRRAVLITLVIVLGYSGCGNLSKKEGLDYVSSLLWTKAYDIEIEGDYAFCSFLNGLKILDVSDKKKPALVSRLFLGGGFGIALQDNLAFIAAGAEGLQVVDVSEAEAPVVIGSLDTPGESRGIAVRGDYAHVADGPSGFQVLDISDPAAPKVVASFDTPGEAVGGFLCSGYIIVPDTFSLLILK